MERHGGGSVGRSRTSTSPICGCIRSPDPSGAVTEVRAEGLIAATGQTYQQKYVLFLRAEGGKVAHFREYFDPVRAARAWTR